MSKELLRSSRKISSFFLPLVGGIVLGNLVVILSFVVLFAEFSINDSQSFVGLSPEPSQISVPALGDRIKKVQSKIEEIREERQEQRQRNPEVDIVSFNDSFHAKMIDSAVQDFGSLPTIVFINEDDHVVVATQYDVGQSCGDNWTCDILDDERRVDWFSLSYYPGQIGLSYHDYETDTLIYVECFGICGGSSNWDEQILATGGGGQYNALAFTSGGHPVISYYDQNTKTLKLAQRSPQKQWNIETIEGEGDRGYYPSIVLNPADLSSFFISTLARTNQNFTDLRVFNSHSGVIQFEDNLHLLFENSTDMVTDGDHYVYLTYQPIENNQSVLYVAGNNSIIGQVCSSWSCGPIDEGRSSSVAIWRDLPVISYHNPEERILKLAVLLAGSGCNQEVWTCITVDQDLYIDDGEPAGTSVATDNEWKIHISYIVHEMGIRHATVTLPVEN